MKYAVAAASLTAQIKTNWTALHPTIPVVMANEPRPTFDEYPRVMHVEIRGGAQRVVAWGGLNNNRFRQSLEVIMRLFVPSQEGEVAVRLLADDAAALLLSYRDGDLIIESSAPASGDAAEENGNWFQFDVIASGFCDLVG